LALSEDGRPQAAMGIGLGDVDGDGRLDLTITNFSDDYNTLYRNLGAGFFLDATYPAGLGEATFAYLGWGTHLFDADQDGDLDLFVANGHVWPEAEDPASGTWYRQRNQLFLNRGDGRFVEVTARAGPGFELRESSRGSALLDLEGDGDLDLVIVNQDAPPTLLVNQSKGGHFLAVELEGTESNRDALGAKLHLLAGGRTQVRERVGADSYLSQSQLREHFGLGAATRIDRLEVIWPSGRRQLLENLEADQVLQLREPRAELSD
ncbi:MAG TPA: CRTAC1 family protein, partial [Acidobacteriota bacterium]